MKRLNYRYHFQDEHNTLILRYDIRDLACLGIAFRRRSGGSNLYPLHNFMTISKVSLPSIEYPNVSQRYSMFRNGESTGVLKGYLLIADNTGKEYSILLITVTHANKSQTEIHPVKCIAYLTGT